MAVILTIALIATATWAVADDVTGASRFLCTAVQATVCAEHGECVADLPWNVNVPQFIELDLDDGRLGTTAASGENRATPIEHLRRGDGLIVFHGYEQGRAFSVCLEAKKYMVKY